LGSFDGEGFPAICAETPVAEKAMQNIKAAVERRTALGLNIISNICCDVGCIRTKSGKFFGSVNGYLQVAVNAVRDRVYPTMYHQLLPAFPSFADERCFACVHNLFDDIYLA
jgi:hypothetical protein